MGVRCLLNKDGNERCGPGTALLFEGESRMQFRDACLGPMGLLITLERAAKSTGGGGQR